MGVSSPVGEGSEHAAAEVGRDQQLVCAAGGERQAESNGLCRLHALACNMGVRQITGCCRHMFIAAGRGEEDSSGAGSLGREREGAREGDRRGESGRWRRPIAMEELRRTVMTEREAVKEREEGRHRDGGSGGEVRVTRRTRASLAAAMNGNSAAVTRPYRSDSGHTQGGVQGHVSVCVCITCGDVCEWTASLGAASEGAGAGRGVHEREGGRHLQSSDGGGAGGAHERQESPESRAQGSWGVGGKRSTRGSRRRRKQGRPCLREWWW